MNTKESLIYLISCSMNKVKPDDEIVKGIDIEAVINDAKRHSVSMAAADALKNSQLFHTKKMDETSMKLINSVYDSAIYRTLLFDEERKKIVGFMEKEGIRYMPLKGILLKEIYPAFGMREMSDNDILFDKKYRQKVCDFFKSEGYDVISVGVTNHDIYRKKPVFNFEMHTALFPHHYNEKVTEYYSEIFEWLEKDDVNHYEYHFTKEDFYIYILIHMYKHFKIHGTGIRSLMDIYLYNKVYGKELDRVYIAHELDKFKLSGYEKKMRKLAYTALQKPDNVLENMDRLSEKDKEILDYILGSGTYGTLSNKVNYHIKNYKKNLTNKSKCKLKMKAGYLLSRIFPEMKFYAYYYPIAYQYKILIPFVAIWRVIKNVLFKREKLIAEIREVNKKI